MARTDTYGASHAAYISSASHAPYDTTARFVVVAYRETVACYYPLYEAELVRLRCLDETKKSFRRPLDFLPESGSH